MKDINNVIEFHKKSKPTNVNDVEEDAIDAEQELLKQAYEEAVQKNKRLILVIESIKGQIAFIEKTWKDFNISEFEIKRRQSYYKDLLHGRKMTYLTNKLDVEKDEIEKKNTLINILIIYEEAFEIVDKLYSLDFATQHTSSSEKVQKM